MAFRRSRYGSRRVYRRRGGSSGGGFSTVRRYKRLQPRLIRSAPLRVVHFHPYVATAAVPSLAASVSGSNYLLNGMSRGTSINDRLGNRIHMMSLVITGEIKFNPFRTNATDFTSSGAISSQWQLQQDCALIIAYLPSRNTLIPDLGEYYDNDGDAVVSTWSLPRIDSVPNMKILYRKDYQFKCADAYAGTTGHTAIAPAALRRVKIKLPLGLKTAFVNNAATDPSVHEIDTGALVLYFLGDYGSTASPPYGFNRPYFKFESRLAFTNLD